jgi:hypothetical protein
MAVPENKQMPVRPYLGLMRYGDQRLNETGHINVLQFINTKRQHFQAEQEVRAILWCPDPLAGGNRHFNSQNVAHSRPLSENPRNPWVHEDKRRRVSLDDLITGVVVSPFASPEALESVRTWVTIKRHQYEVRSSGLAVG